MFSRVNSSKVETKKSASYRNMETVGDLEKSHNGTGRPVSDCGWLRRKWKMRVQETHVGNY